MYLVIRRYAIIKFLWIPSLFLVVNTTVFSDDLQDAIIDIAHTIPTYNFNVFEINLRLL